MASELSFEHAQRNSKGKSLGHCLSLSRFIMSERGDFVKIGFLPLFSSVASLSGTGPGTRRSRVAMAFFSRFFFNATIKVEDVVEDRVKLEPPSISLTPIKREPIKQEDSFDNFPSMPGSFWVTSEPSSSSFMAYPSPVLTPDRRRRVVADTDSVSPPATPLKSRGATRVSQSKATSTASSSTGTQSSRANPPSEQPAPRRSTRIEIPQPFVKPETREPVLLTPPSTPVRAPRQTRTSKRVNKDPPQDGKDIFSFKSDSPRPRQTRSRTTASNFLPVITWDDLEFETPGAAQAGPSSEPPALLLRGTSGVFRTGEQLQGFQATDLRLLLKRERGERVCGTNVVNNVGHVLAYDMGCGKTVMSISLIVLNPAPSNFEGVKSTLVVVPSQGIIDHWLNEVKVFAPHLKAYSYTSVKGTLRLDADIIICTYKQIQCQFFAKRHSKPGKSPLYDVLWYRIVTDEAHVFRNPASQTAQGIWALRKKHGLCLTGTPAQNTLQDYYPLFKFLGVKHEGIDDLDVYKSKLVPKRKSSVLPPGGDRLLRTLKGSFFIVREKVDPKTGMKLVNVPKRTDHIVDVHLTPYEMNVHEYVRFKLPKKNVLARFTHLRQTCDHPGLVAGVVEREKLYEDDSKKAQIFSSDGIFNYRIPSSKIRTMMKILRERPSGEKTIIFTHFTALFGAIRQALEREGIKWVEYSGDMDSKKREQSLKQIKEDDSYTVILISILAGGVGLNILSCSSVILLDPWWNPYVEEQAISRVHRIGQVKPVNVYHLVSVNTVEVYIMETQAFKRKMIEESSGNDGKDFDDEKFNAFDEGGFIEWLRKPNHDESDEGEWRDMYVPMDESP